MEESPILLTESLAANLRCLRERLCMPDNQDVLLRRFRSGAFESALLAIDGMCDMREIDENILGPCMDLPRDAGGDVPQEERVSYLMENAVSILPMALKDNIDELLADVLSGQCALLCEGCAVACVMDTRGFDKRSVGRPDSSG